MKNFKSIHIKATTIEDAWFQCISSVLDNGNKYVVQQGSYVGQTRLEFDFITVEIKFPYAEPYDLMLPQIPHHLNIPNPVADGYIEQYLPYLMSGEKEVKEDYTYGQRINKVYAFDMNGYFYFNQVEHFINLLKQTPNTNQAVLRVCQPEDGLLNDPPCLCLIDIRVKEGELIFYPYFRSWDLWNGFPANLAAIAVLQKYMADEIGIKSGMMCASSKGLHIYGYVEDLAKLRTGKENINCN